MGHLARLAGSLSVQMPMMDRAGPAFVGVGGSLYNTSPRVWLENLMGT